MTKIYGLCEKCNKRFAYLCADCVMRETAATRAELAAEYEQLDKANEAAPSWGAAVGARHERMTAIVRTLVGLDLKEREGQRTALKLTDREITLIRVSLLLRLDTLKRDMEEGTGLNIEDETRTYEEIKAVMTKLWEMRKELNQ